MAVLEFWFDFSCPYAYLASTQVEALADRTGATLEAKPMLLGGVFRAVDTPQKLFATLGPAKTRHNVADMHRWARLFGATLDMPSGHPIRTVEALRCLLVTGAPYMPLAHRFFRAYWVEGRDISDREVLASILTEAGHDAPAVLSKIDDAAVKDDLRQRTDEAVDRGVFGAPAFFVDGQLYWGQDRMDYVEAALGGTPKSILPSQEELQHDVDVWFDYSSPFAYLASTQVERVFGARARWRPMLLGGVFKMVDQVNVPMAAMSDAKRAHTAQDFQRQANRLGATLNWPSRFPMNTVLPLRVTLLAKAHEDERKRAFVHAVYRAYWAEDRDISDPDTVAGLADDAGLDGKALVAGTQDPAVKAALKDATQAAVDAGVFGAPTFIVRPEGAEPALFWGVDRMTLAALAARGDDRMLAPIGG